MKRTARTNTYESMFLKCAQFQIFKLQKRMGYPVQGYPQGGFTLIYRSYQSFLGSFFFWQQLCWTISSLATKYYLMTMQIALVLTYIIYTRGKYLVNESNDAHKH